MLRRGVALDTLPAALTGLVAALGALPLVTIALGGSRHSELLDAAEVVLPVLVSVMIGLATRSLVASARIQTAEARRHGEMLEQVAGVVRDLFASPEPRGDICRAALEVSDATVTLLFEPDHASGGLRCTAAAGLEPGAPALAVASTDPVAAALRTGRARLLTEPLTRPVAGAELWAACGRPGSILYQPLLRGDHASGVLVVGWDASVVAAGGRETVVELLAHGAALAIKRADEMSVLAEMVETDPLTGLPNRRAWDARIARAAHDSEPIAIAMLDIDHFKRFNDTYGHPAGDRLLSDTAAAWRELLRADDLLARLGGEEFGLLLVGCTPAAAAEVTERLRQAVTEDETCSAGLAVRRRGEPIESVLARADHALYDAKAYGRDHSRTAA